jgi:hypothetical protein
LLTHIQKSPEARARALLRRKPFRGGREPSYDCTSYSARLIRETPESVLNLSMTIGSGTLGENSDSIAYGHASGGQRIDKLRILARANVVPQRAHL